MLTGVMLSLGFLACTGPSTIPEGAPPVWDFFPFDGEREWAYISTDSTLPYALLATMDGLPERINGKNVYTVVYEVDCRTNSPDCDDGQRLFVLRWSSDASDGVYVHQYGVGEDPFIAFDPPIHLATDNMDPDDSLTTASNGASWTSTMGQFTGCPVRLSQDIPNCGTWTVGPDAGDGFPLAGQWWAVKSIGVTTIQLTGESGVWELSEWDCSPDTECDGDW
jgi:hypothetical protein